MANQSKADRLLRLSEGRCPIHGGQMGQVGNTVEPDGSSMFVAECGWRTCGIQAKTSSPEGPAQLLPGFEYILNKGA